MTSELENEVVGALRRITRSIDLHSRNLMIEFGLTSPQLAALQAVGRAGPITVGMLARSIHLSQATLTGIVARLEKAALISRTRSGDDRRTVVLQLTESGRHLLQSAPSLLQGRFRLELRKLQDWEQTQLLSALQRVAAMMDSSSNDPILPGDPLLGDIPGELPAHSASGEEVSKATFPGLHSDAASELTQSHPIQTRTRRKQDDDGPRRTPDPDDLNTRVRSGKPGIR